MLLVIDIGNTTVVAGLFWGSRLIAKKWMNTRECAEEAFLCARLKALKDLEGVCISSVVPRLNRMFKRACRKLYGIDPIFATHRNIGLKLKYNPEQVGTDRLVAALAARDKYKRDMIVVDAGTGITIDFVTRGGVFAGGAIAPGMELSARALSEMTARLPLVKKFDPRGVIGRNTRDAIASGICFGTAALVDGIVRRISREAHVRPIVVATGGSAKAIAKNSETIDRVEPDLLLQGLKHVWERNKLNCKIGKPLV